MNIGKSVALLGPSSDPSPFAAQIRAAVLISGIVFVSALVGVAMRPSGFLAAIAPVNALLLGVLVRRPAFATPVGWFAAAIGYVAANLAVDTHLATALLITTGNLAGVVMGFVLFMRRDLADRQLRRPASVLYLAAIVAAAAGASATVGPIINPQLLGHTPADVWAFRFATESVNYMTLLPVVLTMPVPAWFGVERRRRARDFRLPLERMAPTLALVLACMAGVWIDGPGAVAFPVPALLWCAVTYGQSTTSVLTLLFSTWTMIAFACGYIIDPVHLGSPSAVLSVRIGVSLMALAPITVASVMVARNEILEQLRQLAAHDPLTGVLNRRAFVEGYSEARDRRALREREVTVMMLDIDHFKRINDTWGHAVGDKVLVTFAHTVRECLRGSDLLGRYGGEEFVALMCGCSGVQAQAVAERVRLAVAGTIVHIEGGRNVVVTVSIGLAAADRMPDTLNPLVDAADKALFAAKAAGRNQVARAA